MASISPSERPFPFFQLARELRDMVYENLKVTVSAAMDLSEAGPRGPTIEILIPRARLLCRQFQDEAEAQARKSTSLTMNCIRDNEDSWYARDLVRQAQTTATSITLLWDATCAECRELREMTCVATHVLHLLT